MVTEDGAGKLLPPILSFFSQTNRFWCDLVYPVTMRNLVLLAGLMLTTLAVAMTDEQILRVKSDDIVLAIKEKNFAVLAAHMKAGGKLRFAPYVHLGSTDRRLGSTLVTSFFTTVGVKNWGSEDGTGDPILLTTNQYYNKYIFPADFTTAPSVTYNARVASGNTPSNFASIYPGRAFYEYYFPPTNPGDLDWRALDIIWQKDATGLWKLVAVVHDQWTI